MFIVVTTESVPSCTEWLSNNNKIKQWKWILEWKKHSNALDGFGCRWSKCEASFPSFLSSQSFQSTPSIYWVQTVQQKATESSIWPSSGRTDRNLQVANKFEGFESFTSWTIPMNRTGLRRFEEFVGFEGLQTIGRFGCSLMDSSSKLKIWNSNLRFAIKCEFVYLLHSL